jgi:hypothetical protein
LVDRPKEVTKLSPVPVPQVEVLIGLDVLLGYPFLLNGPARRFSLNF